MTLHLGGVVEGRTLYIPFGTYGGTNGESITCSGLAVANIEIYKNGTTTPRASDNGVVLLDTDGIDFASKTGIHGFSVDLSNDSDVGFFSVGGFYWVVVTSLTVDGQSVNFTAATFWIEDAPVDVVEEGINNVFTLESSGAVLATLDEEVVTDAASRIASKADVSALATTSALAAAVITIGELFDIDSEGRVLATLDSEEVVTDAASRTASKADVSALATSAALAVVASAVAAVATDATLARKLLQNRKEFDLDNSKVYLWNDAGGAREYESDLTDRDGAAVTYATQGPINCSQWAVV